MADVSEKKAKARAAAANHACNCTDACRHVFQCCLCTLWFQGYGHNARPVKDGRCCDMCNFDVVIRERMRWIMEEWEKN